MRDPHTKDSRGFAFVTMESSDEADAAVAGMNATELMGRTMMVEKARRGRARTRESSLIVPRNSPSDEWFLDSYSWTIPRSSQEG